MLHSLRLRFTDKPLSLVVTGVENEHPGAVNGAGAETAQISRRVVEDCSVAPHTGSADELDGQMDY
jgi:hypothetical protein